MFGYPDGILFLLFETLLQKGTYDDDDSDNDGDDDVRFNGVRSANYNN